MVLPVVNQKGGVGKTTTAISLATALADAGEHVLLLDLDPQGNATSGLGIAVEEDQPTTYDVLVDDLPVDQATVPSGTPGLDVLPATVDLAGAEIHLVGAMSRERRLKRALRAPRSQYSITLLDCPPSLGLLTVNALSAADALIVPIQCEYYALEGLGALHRNVQLVKDELNPGLQVFGYLLTMHDGRTRLSEQVEAEVRRHFGEEVFSTRIPRSVRLAEAPSYGQSITVFDPSSRAAVAYHRLAREVIARLPAQHAMEASHEST
ncbi:MAG: ParA family protein [Egibacteraceae bacterium]